MAPLGAFGQVRGLREVNYALGKLERAARKNVNDALKQVAEPIAADSRGRIGRYRGASLSTIRPVQYTYGVAISQGARKRANRGDFGALQVRHILGAIYDHEDDLYEAVGDILDSAARREGFRT